MYVTPLFLPLHLRPDFWHPDFSHRFPICQPFWLTNVCTAGEMNADLPERIRGGSSRGPSAHGSPAIGSLKVKLNPDIRKYMRQQESIVASAEEGHWLKRPEIPSNEEIGRVPLEDETVELLPNKQRGKWKSKDRYLEAHFELLREDAISPLQAAVESFCKDPDMVDNHSMAIYEKVRACFPVYKATADDTGPRLWLHVLPCWYCYPHPILHEARPAPHPLVRKQAPGLWWSGRPHSSR